MAGRPNPEAAREALGRILNPGPRTPEEEQAFRFGGNLGTAIFKAAAHIEQQAQHWAQERRARRNGTA